MSDERISQIDEILNRDKIEWQKKILELVKNVKHIKNLSETQAYMLSYRQMILDKNIELKSIVYKYNNKYDKSFKDLYRNYSINYDLNLNVSEKNNFIKADLGDLTYKINILKSHIEFYEQSIKTLDNLGFSIKNRIQLEEYE